MLRYIKGATEALLLRGLNVTIGLKDAVTTVGVVEGLYVGVDGDVGLVEVGFEVGAGVVVAEGEFG